MAIYLSIAFGFMIKWDYEYSCYNFKRAALQKLIKTFNSQQVASKNPYITFAAKVDKVMISVYTSGKVVFQGEKAEEVAKYFGYQAPDASIQTAPAGKN